MRLSRAWWKSDGRIGCGPLAALLSLFLCGAAHASGIDLSAYRGKVVYLDFWASWCGPCRQSFPWLGSLAHEYASQGLIVIGVNVDKNRSLAERFLIETPAAFPILYDPRGELATDYKVAGMPSAVLIDRAGHIRFQHTGYSPKKQEEYEDQMRVLLGEAAH